MKKRTSLFVVVLCAVVLSAMSVSCLEAACTPTAITPYIQVNGGSWQQTLSVTVSAGSTVNLGPQPTTGSWYWAGPNGYISTSRQINSIPLVTGMNAFVLTYTNTSGCQSTATFAITVSGGGATPTPTAVKTPTATSGCTPT
ncbi:MAG: hypothetical protein ABSG25_03310 [Bryobacteraceae bacterium]